MSKVEKSFALGAFIKRLFFLGITFLTFAVQAQKTWTLEACIQYANEHNLVIQQVAQGSRIDDINLEQSKAERLPSLSASASAGRSWGRGFNSVNVQLVDAGVNSASFGVNMNLPLFNGLSTHNTIKQNGLLAESGRLDVLATQEDYGLLIAQSYLLVLQLKEQISNIENQMASSAEQLENTRMKYEKGLVAEYNVLQLESQLAQEEWSKEQLDGQLRVAKINLMQLMDLEVTDDFEVEVPEESKGNIVLESPDNISQIYQTSLALRPEVKSAELQTESSVLGVRVAQGSLLPSLNLNASLNSNYSSASKLVDYTTITQERTIGYLASDPTQSVMAQEVVNVPVVSGYNFRDQLDDNLSPYVGVTMSVPIFSNKRNSSQVQIAKVNREIARLQERETKNQLRKNIEQAYADLENAISQYRASEKQLNLNKRLFENAQYSHESGLISTTEFTIEKNNYLNAENSMALAKYQYLFSRMILGFFNGKPMGF
ncbi:MAG: TolC family protein [Saprospiraceae bacterium]|nr:TolC family protein [Saprospiraceae bacterium]